MTKLSDIRGFTAPGGGGGGGGSSASTYTVKDSKSFQSAGYSSSSTYDFPCRQSGGRKGNKFFTARGEGNGSNNTRMRITPFEVNTSTGAITLSSAGEQNEFNNTSSSGSNTSTIHWTSPDGTGAYFWGANIPIPGHSSHVFAYGHGFVDGNDNGTLKATNYSYSNADHGFNSWRYSPPSSISTGYILTTGYDSNNGSKGRYRQSYWNGSSWSIGSLTNPSSGQSSTSTSYEPWWYTDPTKYQSGNDVCDVCMLYGSSSQAEYRIVAANGNSTYWSPGNNISNGDQFFQMSDGSIIAYTSNHGVKKWQSGGYNSTPTDLSTASWDYPRPNYSGGVGLGNNKFLLTLNTSSPLAMNEVMVIVEINATTGEITTLEYGPAASMAQGFYPYSSSYTKVFTVYENPSDTTPKFLCFVNCPGYAQTRVVTTDWPFTTTI